MSIRVLLVEDHFLARMALRSVLNGRGDISLVAEASVVSHADRLLLSAVLSASHLFEDVAGLCCPDERLRILIVAVDVFSDGHDQLFEVLKDSAPQPVLCEVAKEAFHHVEP